MSKKYRFVFISIAAMFFCNSLAAQGTKHLTLHFFNNVGDKYLHLDTTTYKNKLEQSFTVTNFKYYISNVKLTDSSGKVFENKNGYYLISQADPDSHSIELEDIPAGNYLTISFTVGVDSLHNCNGAQSGALDPINGMFWAWNTGYIFLKLEGKSPASIQPGHIFEYHIGGYKEPANCIRTVTLDISKSLTKAEQWYDQSFKNDKLQMQLISITSNITELLSSHTVVDFSKLSSVTDFHHAPEIADNYKDMFYISCVTSGY